VEAVRIEEQEAKFPRILVSDGIVNLYFRGEQPFVEGAAIIKDQFNRWIINPFPMPFDGPVAVVESFERENFRLSQIGRTVVENIIMLNDQREYSKAEKWIYFKELVEGPVFDASPKLRRFWVW
jgi:hypothetical protein